MATVDLQQGTAEWHEWRKKGIGATDAAAICGYSKWASPMTVYVAKTETVPSTETNEYQEWGTRIEPILIDKIVEEYQSQIAEYGRGGLYISDEWEVAKASLDGWAVLKDGTQIIFECKTGKTADDWSPVPDGYYAQAQWQMFVTGVKQVLFSVLIRGTEWFDRLVEYDEPFVQNMVNKCYTFWTENVLKRVPPEVSNGEKDINALSDLMKLNQDKEDRPEKEVSADLVNEYIACKQLFIQAEEQYNQAKGKLQREMVDGTNLVCDGNRIATWVSRAGSQTINKKLLQELIEPAIYQQCLVRGNSIGYVKFAI